MLAVLRARPEAAELCVLGATADPGEIAASGERFPKVTHKTVGMTTGQAARYCLVSPDTMVKWIKAENLPAQRTIGGKFRILVDDLRRFMVRYEMSTARLDAEVDCRPYCWECAHGARRETSAPGAPCSECLVYRTKALNCFELRAISAERSWARADCRHCAYFLRWANQRSDE